MSPVVRLRRGLAAAVLGVLTAGLTAVPAQAEGQVLGTGAPDPVPGRYIVVLKDGHRDAHRVVSSARRLVGTGGHPELRRTRSGFTVGLTARAARRLAADPAVAFVEQDRLVRRAGTQRNPTWGLDRIDQRAQPPSRGYTPTSTASRVRAYIIDSGIRVTHREFGGRARHGWDFIDDDSVAGDCDGHGTHVAGTVGGHRYGVAKGVQLVAVRVLDCAGYGSLSEVIAGVDWVTDNAVRPAVATMSLGGGYSAALNHAVARSIAAGISYVVAAGNEDRDACGGSPSGLPAAITVAATDARDRRAPFSNHGRCVDLFAPGVRITSAHARSDTATMTWDGTSMAAPHVAGAAAMLLAANPAYTPAHLHSLLVTRATTGKIRDRRAGSPNRLLYTPAPPTAPQIGTTRLPTGIAGRGYHAQLTATPGRHGTWSLAGGALPPGLRLTATGAVTGTPTAAGTGHVTVRFTDYVPRAVTRALTLTVRPDPPLIQATALPTGSTTVGYQAQLSTADGRPGTWTVRDGTLPAGLTLSPGGAITGTPTAAGTATCTVTFTDALHRTASRPLSITITPGPPEAQGR